VTLEFQVLVAYFKQWKEKDMRHRLSNRANAVVIISCVLVLALVCWHFGPAGITAIRG